MNIFWWLIGSGKLAGVRSRVLKQPGETMMVSNSSPINKRMKGKRTTWNVSNSGTLASNDQGSGLLRNKLLIPNGGGGALVLSPSLNLGGPVLTAWSASLLAQNDRVIRPMTSSLSAKSSFLKDLQHGSNALADLTTFGGFVLRLWHRKVEKATQLLRDGGRNDGDAQRPPMP